MLKNCNREIYVRFSIILYIIVHSCHIHILKYHISINHTMYCNEQQNMMPTLIMRHKIDNLENCRYKTANVTKCVTDEKYDRNICG